MNIFSLQPYMQFFLDIAAIVAVLYGAKKFLGAPQNDLEKRIAAIEVKQADLERSLNTNWEQTRKQQSVMDDIQLCILYLLDFEAAYCSSHSNDDGTKIDTTNLDKARDTIRQRLKQ